MKAFILAISFLLFASPALAGGHCAPREDMLEFLGQRYKEAAVIIAESSQGGTVIITVDPLSGEWSSLSQQPKDPNICVAGSGKGHKFGMDQFKVDDKGVKPLFVGRAHNGFLVFLITPDGWQLDVIYDSQPPVFGIASGPSFTLKEYSRPEGNDSEPVTDMPPWVGEEV